MDVVPVLAKKAKCSSSGKPNKKHTKDATVNDNRKSPPEKTTKATPSPKVAAAASANNCLHFTDEDEEEEGEIKINVPLKSNNDNGNNDRMDNEDAGLLTVEDQSTFQQEHFEVISKCRFNFQAYQEKWRREPIRRGKDNIPIGTGSFFQRKSFNYSQAELWAGQGHKDRVHRVGLTIKDHQNHITDGNVC